jgi:site-specific DNA-methyltransferase (adenine-specific)
MSNRVILGDCYDILKTIDKNSIDLILTDPPYNISRQSNFTKNSDNKKFNNISIDFGDWDQEEIDLESLMIEFKRVLKPGGVIIIFYDIWKCNNLKSIAEKLGLKQPRVCQWVKNNPVPINSKKNYLSNSIEFFFTFVKGKNPTFNSSYDKGIYNFPLCHGNERTEHPTQKPLSLIKSLIEKHSKEDDVILDPFGGSGTTAIASIETNRRYFLIEKENNYYNITISRIEQSNSKKI